MRVAVGASLASGRSGAAAPAAPNPNLLLWSEEAQRPSWTTDGMVAPNSAADPLGGMTADAVVLPEDGFLQQVSSTAATTGANANLAFALTTEPTRYSVSGVFDGTTYVFSYWLSGATGSEEVRLILTRSGGFIACVVLENTSSVATITVWGAKLETATLTTYVKREGA